MLDMVDTFGRTAATDVERIQVEDDQFELKLANDVTIAVPWCILSDEFEGATLQERAECVHDRERQCVRWERLGVSVLVDDLLDRALHKKGLSASEEAQALGRAVRHLARSKLAENRLAAAPSLGGHRVIGYRSGYAIEDDRRISDLYQRVKQLEARLDSEPPA